MKPIKVILIFIGALYYVPVVSQDSVGSVISYKNSFKSTLKFSPFHLINFYPSVQFAYEHTITPNASLQIDLGYVFYNYSTADFIRKRGIKAKLEYRYYLNEEKTRRNTPYLSVEPYINAVNFNREENIIQCFDLNCQNQFSMRVQYLVQYRETGLSIKYGKVISLKRNFIFDFNYGITMRFIRYHEKGRANTPNEAGFLTGLFNIPNEQNRIGIAPALGLRIGYILAMELQE